MGSHISETHDRLCHSGRTHHPGLTLQCTTSEAIDGVTPANGTSLTTIELGHRSGYDLEKGAKQQLKHAPTCEAFGHNYNLNNQVWDVGHTRMIPQRLRAQATRPGVTNVDRLR
jgi:hypothetical protein